MASYHLNQHPNNTHDPLYAIFDFTWSGFFLAFALLQEVSLTDVKTGQSFSFLLR